MEEIIHELRIIGIKLVGLLIMTPIAGCLLLRVAEHWEKEWKSGNQKKKWLVMCGVFFILAIIGGWLR